LRGLTIQSPRTKAKVDRRLMHYKLLAASLLMCLVACSTVRNVSPPPIAVPNKLTENDVELAILMAIADRAVSPKLTAGEKVTDSHLSMVNDPASNSARRQKESWYFEDRQPRIVYAGFQDRQFYMRVAVRYDARNVNMEIVDSRGLKQSEDKIHKRAFVWLRQLEQRVRRALGTLASRV
jgi:hypothetical protein